MNQAETISPFGSRLLDRRNFLRNTAGTLGGLGLAHLLPAKEDDPAAFSGKLPIRPDIDPNNPYSPRSSHFDAAAKQVLVIYCPGAVSHVDTFDYKPALEKIHGQKAPFIPEVTFEGPPGNVAKPFWEFKPRGESGKMTSELLPRMGALADDFCFIHSLTTQTSAHPQGENFMNTGFTMEGFPSFGFVGNLCAWFIVSGSSGFCCDQRSPGTRPFGKKQFWKRIPSRSLSGNRLQRQESTGKP